LDAFRVAIGILLKDLITAFGVNINTAIDIMSMNLQTDPLFSEAYAVCQTIAETVIAPATGVIVGICFFIEFIKTTIRIDMIKFENVLAALFKFVFAKAAIDIAPDLVLAFYEMGSDWVVDTAGRGATGAGINDFTTNLRNNIHEIMGQGYGLSNFEWYESLALSAIMGVVFLAIFIIGVLVVVIAYARAVEILLYIAVAPLPCSFILMDNGQVTKRFLLQFLGVVLQGVLMLIIIIIYQNMVIVLTGNITHVVEGGGISELSIIVQNCSVMMIATITLMAAIMKSGSLAKQMLSG
jgi:hypothetical protein